MIEDVYGLPQGTILGRILFSIFINDTSIHLNSTTFLFADDNTLVITGYPNEIQDTILKLEHDNQLLVTWLENNMLQINASKTECIGLGSLANVKKIGTIKNKVNGMEIESAETIRILRLHIDNTLTWSFHVDQITRKRFAQLRPLQIIKPMISLENLKILIKSLVLSHINTMCSVWGNADQTVLKNLDKVINMLCY